MALDAGDLLDLYSADDPAMARARADAMSQRARGLQGAGLILRSLTGDRDPTGGALTAIGSKDADQLASAAQHAAQLGVQRQHYAALLGHQKAQEQRWQDETANEKARLEQGRYTPVRDLYGNPTHMLDAKTGAVRPLLVGGSGGAAPGGTMPGGGALGLSSDAIDQAAELYHRTGTLPPIAIGKAGAPWKMRIVNRAAELHPDADLAGNKAGFHADQSSLAKLQTQADAVNAFERTAMANLDQFLTTAKGVVDTGSPLFNMPARKFAEKVAGDPELTKFNVARQVAVQEIGKVLSGAMGNAAISDSARHEVGGLLSPDASLAQIEQAAGILRRDMENRRKSYEAELGAVRQRAGGKKAVPAAAAPVLSAEDAQAKAWADANPTDSRAAKILEKLKAKGGI